MSRQRYPGEYYTALQEGARRSAEVIVPLVMELVQPRRVIDVGCGPGTWLSVFKACGVETIWGVDGIHVDKMAPEIPIEHFISFDLERPFSMEQRFDLVVSLEVAEHLPGECAETFVDSLTGLGPVVLFSAAAPFQGGRHHINEQWPDYWAKRFRAKGYVVVDCVRKKVWHNESVEWWYAQNTLMFVEQDHLNRRPMLKREYENTATSQLSIVHPKKYLETIEWMRGIHQTTQEITALIPPEEIFILVDEDQLASMVAVGRRAVPFLEREGRYWGTPPDDENAVRELERLRGSGAGFIVFAWPAFWWLDHYQGLRRHLRSGYRCVLENERLVAFDLRR